MKLEDNANLLWKSNQLRDALIQIKHSYSRLFKQYTLSNICTSHTFHVIIGMFINDIVKTISIHLRAFSLNHTHMDGPRT